MATINQTIKQGITQTTTPNAYQTNNNTIKQTEKQLLAPLIKDEQLLELMLEEQNIQKIKHRFEHQITFQNSQAQELASATTFNETLTQVTQEIRELVPSGTSVSPTQTQPLQQLKNAGYTKVQVTNTGTITKAQIKTIFRKAQQ